MRVQMNALMHMSIRLPGRTVARRYIHTAISCRTLLSTMPHLIVADSTSDMGCDDESFADSQGCLEGSADNLPHLGKNRLWQQAVACCCG